MHYRTVLVLLILALMYLVVYFYGLATGMNFYYVQILAYTLVLLLTWSDAVNHVRFNKLSSTVFFFTVSYISAYMLTGLWTGYGLTPYSTTPLGVLVNVVFTASRIASLEFLRLYVVNGLRYKHRSLLPYLPALIVWFLTWFPYTLLALPVDSSNLKTAFRYLLPSFISNMYSTFLVLNNGFTSSLIYNLLPQLFTRMIPYLPNLDWLVEGALNTLTPLLGFYVVLPYSSFRRKHRKLLNLESRGVAKLIAYFTLMILLLMVLQGYLGFRLYVVSSKSMEPSLRVGDVVIVCNYCRNFREGDIVAYISEFGVVVHRVVEVNSEAGFVVTKGDANTDVDSKPVSFRNIIGKAIYSVPLIGYVSIYTRKTLSSSFSLVLFATLVTVIGAYGFLRRYRWR